MTYLLITLALMVIAVVLWAMVCFSYVIRQHQQMATCWERVDAVLEARHEIYRQLISLCQKPAFSPLAEQADTLHHNMLKDKELPWDDTEERCALQRDMRQQVQDIFQKAQPLAVAQDAPFLQELATDLTHADQQLAGEVEHYNKAVTLYNRLLHSSPNHLWARSFGFIAAPLCELY